jgi:hypothetical protein
MSKRPLSPLTLGTTLASKGEGATAEAAATTVVPMPPVAPATPQQPALPAQEPRVLLSYRPRISTHEALRRISFETRRPMQELVDEAVEAWLRKRQSD